MCTVIGPHRFDRVLKMDLQVLGGLAFTRCIVNINRVNLGVIMRTPLGL